SDECTLTAPGARGAHNYLARWHGQPLYRWRDPAYLCNGCGRPYQYRAGSVLAATGSQCAWPGRSRWALAAGETQICHTLGNSRGARADRTRRLHGADRAGQWCAAPAVTRHWLYSRHRAAGIEP